MIRTIGAQVGLLTFSVAVFAGLMAGNSAATILLRAVGGMVIGMLVGQFAAWAARQVLRDHFQQRKLEIDQSHLQAVRELREDADEDSAASAVGKAG